MKRIPVTQASYKKIQGASASPKGVPGVSIKVGKPDKSKERQASYLGWGGFGGFGRPTMLGSSSTFYNNSYMNGGRSGGMGDVPPWIALLNEANGGILYYPTTLKEKYELYRYFMRSDPYVKAAVELNTDLPLSRLLLRMPKMDDKKKAKKIQKFYENMIDEIHLYDKLHSVLFEYNVIGNCLPAGHVVRIPEGYVSIEEIREGMEVLTEKGTFEKVAHAMRRMTDEPLYHVKFVNKHFKGISPTGEHPVFILKDGVAQCVPAKELKAGDCAEVESSKECFEQSNGDGMLMTGGKLFCRIESVEQRPFNGYVYNLEVENEHTYCVNGICTHNCFLFCQYSEDKKRWDKLVVLPPEEVNAANYPMSDYKQIQYRPEMLNSTILKYDLRVDSYESYMASIEALPEEDRSIFRDVSYEFAKQIKENNGILKFDTDPYHPAEEGDKIGSFVFHFAHKRHEYQDLGVSPLECVMTSLLQKTHYMFTQLSLASRNMTPRNLIVADKITADALDDLRDQVDQSMLSPDYSIVTNYQVQWEQIGAESRLIDLQRENEVIENQLFAGLGVTRELLTGEGMYSGNKISIEILNTKYLLVREILQRFVEESLFKPVALQNGFYEDDEDGNRTWYYPKLGFTRLTIRDNQEVFDQLFQLYQKGSLPIGMILDIFNINSDEVDEELKKDLFTVKDATYNEMLRQAYSALGDKLAENTDLVKQVVETMVGPTGKKLKYTGEDSEEGGGDDNFGLGGDEEGGGFSLDEGGGDEGGGDEGFPMDEGGGGEEAPAVPEENEDNAPAEEGGSTEDKVKEYLDGITGGGEEGDDGKAKEYIDNIVGDGSDDSAEKYIDSFLGKSGGDVKESSDDSDALQDAVLVDEPEESSASPNDVGDFLTGR